MITIFSALILGIVEGLTEFLPVSSTAHLVLVSNLMGISQSDFTKTFEIALQSGAILAVLFFYFNKFSDLAYLKKIIVAFIPTGVIGLLFYKIIKSYLLGNVSVILWALGLGGLALLAFEYLMGEKTGTANIAEISYEKAAIIGLFQSIAIIPGVSRSAATIIGGMLLGISRATIVEFSFLLAVPTMAAATGLDLLKNAGDITGGEMMILGVGLVVSFLAALASIRFFLEYIRKNNFIPFGIYRILVAIAFVFFI